MNPLRKIGRTAAPLLALAAVLAVSPPAGGAQSGDATVSASLVDPSVDAGQPAEFHIDVVNGRPDHPPSMPPVDGLTINYSGESQSQRINFGSGFQMERTVTTTYVYSIETSRRRAFHHSRPADRRGRHHPAHAAHHAHRARR